MASGIFVRNMDYETSLSLESLTLHTPETRRLLAFFERGRFTLFHVFVFGIQVGWIAEQAVALSVLSTQPELP
jgi:hypothetical protein